MKTLSSLAFVCCGLFLNAQEIVKLPNTDEPPVTWETPENDYFSTIWNTQVVTNVSEPTMQVFRPKEEINTGTAVIVAPGGGLFALSINSEGNEVAKWLNEKGITAFVLKYRLVPTGEDGVAEIENNAPEEPEKFMERVNAVLPYSIKDGLNAIKHVRENAANYGVDPNKIGFMGFSAGGAVTVGVAYNYQAESKPDFLVPVYYWASVIPLEKPKEDAPPLFLVCASDDPLDLATGTIALYSSWLEAGKSVALHMYSKGGHGFGMRKQGLPSDTWIERFYEWSKTQNLVSDY
ncbi:alpha/beta hydrolase [Flagellimonas taeanensis]|uniref:Acetyl esterase/lipase n=1 Tax=Flagellimonas taeanensis TaxID=1005926 RepID=A0A1M6S0N1_9FLAO|nr:MULTISPECIES: alpha/beta hydrolase [Allomuricauda]MDC6384492.1 alpha/beta hydrolase [Muricauda sp. SK9]RIV52172.1 alpha/beta hydrolase [Allomuricauda taeanensis]SFB77294.1 Acetyl esterase/lipase [Allomuricauda taeanensis]SHK38118.1 Acetyl esterase/lipase [Allomuricauda taeanensis]